MKFMYLLIRLLLLILIFNAPTFAVHCCFDGCPYTSDKQSHMDIHERIHTGEKPYHCPMCDKRYAQSGNLTKHKNAVHHKIKSHECTFGRGCGKSFATSTGLKIHIRTHTGEKPYHCQTCDKRYAQSKGLKHHMDHNHQRAEGGAVNQVVGVGEDGNLIDQAILAGGIEAPVARATSPDPRLAVGDMPGTSGIARPARPETRNILDGFLDYERDSERDMTTPAPQVFKSYLPEYE